MSVGLVGVGELGAVLARALAGSDGAPVRAFARRPERAAGLPVELAPDLAGAVRDAAVVLVAVPGEAAVEVAVAAAPLLSPAALYVDLATAAPEVKREAAARVDEAGARYADVAVLGTVAASGARVPMLASGPGAGEWAQRAGGWGMDVRALDAPAGHAALVKLLRSVYLKGRDALIAEMLLAARRHGLESEVAASIAGPGEEVPFADLAERVVTALAIHAGRRAGELDASAEVLAEAGVEPVVTRAGAERLRRLAELGLRDAFAGQRPESAARVLEEIERRSAADEPQGG